MTLSPSERQTLIGPLVVGCIFGAFAGYAVFAFASEYTLQNGSNSDFWRTALEAAIAFLVAAGVTVGVLGVLPILVGRWRAKGNRSVYQIRRVDPQRQAMFLPIVTTECAVATHSRPALTFTP